MDKKAKIICTIGPASRSEDTLALLMKAGMNVARLNFSHGSHDEHQFKIWRIRKVAKELNIPVAILQDLQGPKIRIGTFENGAIRLNPADKFTLTIDENVVGNSQVVSVSYKNLVKDIDPGDIILVNDGLIKLKVLDKNNFEIKTEVINGGSLYDKRGINLPGVNVSEPSLTEKDKKDLLFGLKNNIDYAALSFVRDAKSILELKAFMGDKKIPVIAKLEKPEALNNLDAIIKAADGIMVARGDLGVEIPAAKVPVVQKTIIEKSLMMEKPVITATQMLDSMMDNPVPTRAETADVANAIFDGSDAVMLSGETAFGKYPVEAAKTMASIIKEAEAENSCFRIDIAQKKLHAKKSFSHSICYSAYYGADEIEAKLIIVFTRSGKTAKILSNYRPHKPIVAFTHDEKVERELALYWGIETYTIDKDITVEDNLCDLVDILKKLNLAKSKDRFVLITGSTGQTGGTDMMKLHQIS
jgi:pyruvate kinase